MTRLQLLLLKLGEEAVEIAKEASKASQFGMEESLIGCEYTNKERVQSEIDDLNVIIHMLNEEFNFEYEVQTPELMIGKIDKVNKYANYSKQLGMVE